MAPSRLRHSHVAGDESKWKSSIALVGVSALAALLTYMVLSPLFHSPSHQSTSPDQQSEKLLESIRDKKAACCRGIEHQELWGSVITWGNSHKLNSSAACCQACKSLCSPTSQVCKCNSWVYCGDPIKCGSRQGECWLKKQDDPLSPDVQDSSSEVYWTSGLVFGKNMGLVQLETVYGAIRLQLLPDCAPLSVAYIIELLKLRHCAGCNFYRAESRGSIWDAEGNPYSENVKGPPYGLLQGSLDAEGIKFKELPKESCPSISRGMVGWIDGGPDFFISLANHKNWYPKHTVFAKVLPDDLPLVEKLANLPTKKALWNNVDVAVLKKPISLKLQKAPVPSTLSST